MNETLLFIGWSLVGWLGTTLVLMVYRRRKGGEQHAKDMLQALQKLDDYYS